LQYAFGQGHARLDVTHNPAVAFAPVGVGAATVLLMAVTLRLSGGRAAASAAESRA
jgi:hypothetical protein